MPSSEILNYLLSRYSDIQSMIIGLSGCCRGGTCWPVWDWAPYLWVNNRRCSSDRTNHHHPLIPLSHCFSLHIRNYEQIVEDLSHGGPQYNSKIYFVVKSFIFAFIHLHGGPSSCLGLWKPFIRNSVDESKRVEILKYESRHQVKPQCHDVTGPCHVSFVKLDCKNVEYQVDTFHFTKLQRLEFIFIYHSLSEKHGGRLENL